MDTMELYRRAQDGFDAVLADVRPEQWDAPSACAEWTVLDVAGHVIWGQHQMQAWATGEDYTEKAGAPGAPRPAVMASEEPVATWRSARAASVATLTEETLARLITDHVAHTWDIGHALGMDVRRDPVLVAVAFDWARANMVRRPGFFGPELTPLAGADEQTRMLAFLGRAAWQPVPA
jgi:uncharacterized protein (TIGR03086 family)